MPASTRLFLFLGLSLIILAAIVLPTRMMLAAQPMDPDPYNVGWLFSPVIGAWGLFSVAFGLIQSPWKKSKVQAFLLPVFALALVVMLFMFFIVLSLSALLIQTTMIDVQLFWSSYGTLSGIPCIIVSALTLVYLRRKEEKGPVFVGKKLRVAAFTMSIVVPLLYSVALYYSLTMSSPV